MVTVYCPKCNQRFEVSLECIGRRGICSGCTSRILLTDVASESRFYAAEFQCRAGKVLNGFRRYSVKVGHIDQESAISVLGSSADTVFANGWLIWARKGSVPLFIAGKQVGGFSKRDSDAVLRRLPFYREWCALCVATRMTPICKPRRIVIEVDLTCLEPIADEHMGEFNEGLLPLDTVDTALKDAIGKSSIAKNLTLRQQIDYLNSTDDAAQRIRHDAFEQASAAYFTLPSQAFEYSANIDWVSGNYLATISLNNGVASLTALKRTSSAFFSCGDRDFRTRIPLEVDWLCGVKSERSEQAEALMDDEPASATLLPSPLPASPYVWGKVGRSAVFTLEEQRHVAGQKICENECKVHFWTQIAGLGIERYVTDGATIEKCADQSQNTIDLKRGDALILKREPTNPYDRYAIQVFSTGREFIGYLPRALVCTIPPRCTLAAMVSSKTPEGKVPARELKLLVALGGHNEASELEDYLNRAFLAPPDERWQ